MSTFPFTLSSLSKPITSSFTAHLPPLPQNPKPPSPSIHTTTNTLKMTHDQDYSTPLGRRGVLSGCFGAALGALSLSASSEAAILEADDDVELLEKVKKDREKRLQRQGVISSSNKETGYLQELVYKLSKVGQAIENSDFSTAASVLGQSTEADWLQRANSAFTKLSSSPEAKAEVDMFNSSLATLISSVDKNDIESCRMAFVSSASALEKWVGLTGLIGQLKGL
ncbi:thylakoid lumenal 16.5 kDa protein, chloroplastic [Asparagus officinalis]|uniref:thylakoid lumenal 16.5 kDa protein, chloroplastic n=1 Tax=Asparagus officinalis TaxID=4686 RepID=UPI00098E4ABB|nr:thylakoid lumenal 16.5 kDa protein, chloroplastic [Asparagus officinalis]